MMITPEMFRSSFSAVARYLLTLILGGIVGTVIAVVLIQCSGCAVSSPATPELRCPEIGHAYAAAVARLNCPSAAPTLVGCEFLDRPCPEISYHGALGWRDPDVAAGFESAPSCTWLETQAAAYCPELAQ